jgi:hypothetical protein
MLQLKEESTQAQRAHQLLGYPSSCDLKSGSQFLHPLSTLHPRGYSLANIRGAADKSSNNGLATHAASRDNKVELPCWQVLIARRLLLEPSRQTNGGLQAPRPVASDSRGLAHSWWATYLQSSIRFHPKGCLALSSRDVDDLSVGTGRCGIPSVCVDSYSFEPRTDAEWKIHDLDKLSLVRICRPTRDSSFCASDGCGVTMYHFQVNSLHSMFGRVDRFLTDFSPHISPWHASASCQRTATPLTPHSRLSRRRRSRRRLIALFILSSRPWGRQPRRSTRRPPRTRSSHPTTRA